MRKCSDCPSFVRAADVKRVLNQDLGTDVCARFGHIESRPGQTDEANERIQIAFAENCANYGEAKPEHLPAMLSGSVAIGDPHLHIRRMARTGPIPDDERPESCTGCQHFIPADIVRRELGWTPPMCAALGRLLAPSRLITEALGCSEGEKGTNRDTTDGPILFPQYEQRASVVVPTGPRTVAPPSLLPAIDPREYESDRPVSDWDRENHVLGWRVAHDPEGLHEDRYWPILDWKALGVKDDPRESFEGNNLKPELYLDHGGLFYDMVCELMVHEKVPVLIGAAGTGKTEAIAWMAWLADMPFDLLSLRDDTETFEFIGETQLREAVLGVVTEFVKGLFTAGFPTPGMTALDEINLAPEAVMHYLRPILLGAMRLHIASANLYIQKHYWRFLAMAMNPSWDQRYIGTKQLAAPDFERMRKIAVDLPPENIEREIIRTHCNNVGYALPESILDQIMQIATVLRPLSTAGTIPVAWGIRPQVMVALGTQTYSLTKSYRRACTDGIEASVAQNILDAVELTVAGV